MKKQENLISNCDYSLQYCSISLNSLSFNVLYVIPCAKKVKFKQDVKEFLIILRVIATFVLLPLSLLYLLIVGIFYLIKRRLLGRKWLLIITIILLILSIISTIDMVAWSPKPEYFV